MWCFHFSTVTYFVIGMCRWSICGLHVIFYRSINLIRNSYLRHSDCVVKIPFKSCSAQSNILYKLNTKMRTNAKWRAVFKIGVRWVSPRAIIRLCNGRWLQTQIVMAVRNKTSLFSQRMISENGTALVLHDISFMFRTWHVYLLTGILRKHVLNIHNIYLRFVFFGLLQKQLSNMK
jgi:hypothetical protein